MIDQDYQEQAPDTPEEASSSFSRDTGSMGIVQRALLAVPAAGNMELVNNHATKLGVDIIGHDREDMTALHHAAKSDTPTVAQRLLDEAQWHGRGPVTPCALATAAAPLHHGATPLHFAAQHSAAVLRLLLRSCTGGAQEAEEAQGGKLLVSLASQASAYGLMLHTPYSLYVRE